MLFSLPRFNKDSLKIVTLLTCGIGGSLWMHRFIKGMKIQSEKEGRPCSACLEAVDWPSAKIAAAVLYGHWANHLNTFFLELKMVESDILGLGYCAVLTGFLVELWPQLSASVTKLIDNNKSEKIDK